MSRASALLLRDKPAAARLITSRQASELPTGASTPPPSTTDEIGRRLLPCPDTIAGVQAAGIEIDRKALADIAVHDIAAFGAIAEKAKAALAAK